MFYSSKVLVNGCLYYIGMLILYYLTSYILQYLCMYTYIHFLHIDWCYWRSSEGGHQDQPLPDRARQCHIGAGGRQGHIYTIQVHTYTTLKTYYSILIYIAYINRRALVYLSLNVTLTQYTSIYHSYVETQS